MGPEADRLSEASQKKSMEELAGSHEWWWVAEKKRSKRLDYLRKAVWKKGKKGAMYEPGIKIDIERPLLFIEGWENNESGFLEK